MFLKTNIQNVTTVSSVPDTIVNCHSSAIVYTNTPMLYIPDIYDNVDDEDGGVARYISPDVSRMNTDINS